ncbi:MAG: AbrB/MazE/SpoVT family DNA-binding domain-containing protein [archaeon]
MISNDINYKMEGKKFNSKITQWGLNLGIRIPREIVKANNFRDKEEVEIVSTKTGFQVLKIVPETSDSFVI